MEIRNFKAVNHARIKANFNIYIPQWDLYLNKMTLIYTDKGKFVSSPSQKYEKDGETNYFPYFAFGKDSKNRFQESVMALLKPLLVKEEAPEEEEYVEHQEELPF